MLEPTVVLHENEWRDLQSAHRDRVTPWVSPRQERRRAGATHPVDDFLFDYYPYSAAKLTAWHPGFGVLLSGGAQEFLGSPAYVRTHDGVTVGEHEVARLRDRLVLVIRLLGRTADRAPQWGCFGLHEWAMVHGQPDAELRHSSYGLRLPQARVAETIDELGLRCTHIDAYRFFTPSSLARNAHRPTRETQHEWEQPGCLHANMDLYKYAMWFRTLVGSALVADCFELARRARQIDMRAAPYDLRDLGFPPIRVETAEGRREYVAHQRQIAETARQLRSRLLSRLQDLCTTGADEVIGERTA